MLAICALHIQISGIKLASFYCMTIPPLTYIGLIMCKIT